MIRASRPGLVLLLSFAVGGCSAGGGVPEDLAEARAVWDSRSIHDYTMTIQQTCFCPPELLQPLAVEVTDGQVNNITGLERPLEHAELLDTRRLTVEGLFRFIENARTREPARLTVEFSPKYGIPVSIQYDGDTMIADDELQYRILDFQPR